MAERERNCKSKAIILHKWSLGYDLSHNNRRGRQMRTKDKCIECGKPAVCYWPACDPDIESNPYCRKCVRKTKKRVMLKIIEIISNKAEDSK